MTQTRYAQTRVLLIPVGLRSSAHLEGDPGFGIGGAQRRIAPRARNRVSALIAICSDVTTRTTTPISRPRRDARQSRADPAPQGPPLQSAEEHSPTGISRAHV